MDAVAAWRERAACVGLDPRHWDIDHPNLWERGIDQCRRCPVQVECLAEHQGNRAASGVYGGVPLERGHPVNAAQKVTQQRRLRSIATKRALLRTVIAERWGDHEQLLDELA